MSTVTQPVTSNLADMLAAVAKPKAPAASEKMPVVARAELAPMAKKLAQTLAQLKDLEAQKAMLVADLMPAAEHARADLARQRGENLSSIRFCGLTYQTQCRYADVKPELAARIKAAHAELFATYFREQYAVNIDVGKLTPQLLQNLIAAGAEVTVTVQPTKQFHEDRTLRPDVAVVAASLPDIKPVAFFRA
ncbi:MAG TPA: hypothetical protein VGP72_05210 [Planctomycetota bacterium]|jgi:hypothetical protein